MNNKTQRVVKYVAMGVGLLLAASIILAIVKVVFGILNVSNIASDGMRVVFGTSGNSISKTISFADQTDTIRKIEIDNQVGTFEIKVGDKLEVVAENIHEKSVIKIKDDTLVIDNEKFDLSSFQKNTHITLYIPNGMQFDDVDISSGVGDLTIEQLQSDEFSVSAGVGDFYGANIVATKADLSNSVGNLVFDDCIFSEIELDSGVGDTEFNRVTTQTVDIDCGVGDVYFSIVGDENTFNIQADKGLGDVEINGEKYQKATWNRSNASNKIKIDAGVGSVDIDFNAVVE